ncbi:MAG: M20/M25/M40 family metallo-hydrolase [Planctomycetota bacterium]
MVHRLICQQAISSVAITALIAGFFGPRCHGQAKLGAEEQRAAATITPEVMRGAIRFLADDLLEGRGPASRGDQLAELYIAAELERLGLLPAAPGGGWYQKFDVLGVRGKPGSLTAAGSAGKAEFKYFDDFIAVAGNQQPSAQVEGAEVVFVGYGIDAPEYAWDDYKGADLRGKVLLMMNNDPEADPDLFAGKTRLYYGRWTYKYEIAAAKGAAAALIIHTDPSAGYPWQVVQTSWSGEQFEIPLEKPSPLALKMWATEKASRSIAALGGQDLDQLRAAAEKRDFRPVSLGVRLTLAVTSEVHAVKTGNVIGMLPGRDPALAREAVIYTAHHDHLGVAATAKPGADRIYNGAVDNASGVAGMLAIARAFQALPQPPRRSILFAAVAAEEQGLLGSRYLAQHPPLAPGFLAANINIDSVSIFGRAKDLTMIGLGKSSLDALAKELAAAQDRVLLGDQFPDKGYFYRSDQFNLAKIGVPAAYFEAGIQIRGKPEGWGKQRHQEWEETDYHQPSDELKDGWDLAGAVEDMQLDFLLGLRVANQDALPAWNPGDEFEAARKAALKQRGTP